MNGPGRTFPDGFCGGGEMPDDLDLDRMIYPQDCTKPSAGDKVKWDMDETYEQHQQKVEAANDAERTQDFERSRKFEITEGNVTGRRPGPPGTE